MMMPHFENANAHGIGICSWFNICDNSAVGVVKCFMYESTCVYMKTGYERRELKNVCTLYKRRENKRFNVSSYFFLKNVRVYEDRTIYF